MTQEKLDEAVRQDVVAIGTEYYTREAYSHTERFIPHVTKEELGRKYRVLPSQVQTSFAKLNLEGMLAQPTHHAPHDSKRDPWGSGGDSAWMSDRYEIWGKFWDKFVVEQQTQLNRRRL